jgi:hypothetical protein
MEAGIVVYVALCLLVGATLIALTMIEWAKARIARDVAEKAMTRALLQLKAADEHLERVQAEIRELTPEGDDDDDRLQ